MIGSDHEFQKLTVSENETLVDCLRKMIGSDHSIPDAYGDGRVHPIDDAYVDFHRRQLEDLETHGDRRVREAQAVRQQANQLVVLQGVANRFGHYDGGYGIVVDKPEPTAQQWRGTDGSKRHHGAGVVDHGSGSS